MPKDTPLTENPDIQELLKILKKQNMTGHIKTINNVLKNITALENQFDSVQKQLESVNLKLEELAQKKHPVSDAFKKMVQSLKDKAAEIKSQINGLKQQVADEARKMVSAFKQKGISALSSIANFLHIKESLQTSRNDLLNTVKKIDRAIEKLNNLDEKAKKPSVLGKVEENKAVIAKTKANTVKKTKSQEAAI